MSFYDDASLIFDASAAAGKDGTAFNLKPVEELTGPNKVINGGFDSDSDWSKGTGWSISGGLASCDGTQTGNTGLSQLLSSDRLEEGETYKVTYTISNYVAGNVNPHIRGTSTGNVNGNGTKVVYGIAGNNASYDINFFADSNFNASIDNVSIRKVVNKAADFTFTRGSNLSATRIGPDGFIEKGRENLAKYSNDFSQSVWLKLNNVVLSGQTATDPFGNPNSAWNVVFDGTTSCRIEQPISGVTNGGVYAPSIWARTKSGTQDVSFGSVYTDIFTLTTEWQRLSLYEVEQDTNAYLRLICHDATTLEVYGAQLEVGLVATDYIETGATTATAGLLEDEPRFDYSGGGCPALLMEPSSTNKVPHSEYFGGWTALNSTVTDNDIITPEGVKNGAKLLASGSGTVNHQIDTPSLGGFAGSAITGSIFAKKGNTDFVRLRLNGTSSQIRAWFNLSSGAVGTVDGGGTGTITDMGDGWYKCTVSEAGNTNTTGLGLQVFINEGDGDTTWTADGDEYIYIYGAQLEEGSYPTSYIPTYGTAATRSKEGAADSYDQIAALDLSSIGLDGEDVSWFFEFKNNQDVIRDNGNLNVRVSSNTSNLGSFRIYRASPDDTRKLTVVFQDTGSNFSPSGYETTSENPKILIRRTWSTGRIQVHVDGVSVIDATNSNLNRWYKLELAGEGSTLELKQVLAFPMVLSNNDCEILTGTSYTSFASMASTLSYTQYE